MTADGKTAVRIERAARLRWVPLAQMRVNPLAQRDLNQARVSALAAAFDPELMDAPTVNHRGDWYYLLDGQHRVAALKLWMPSWQDQQVQCWTYEGLSEAQEAGRSLALNDSLPVRAFAKFKVSIQAGRDTEGDVDRIVRALGLRIVCVGIRHEAAPELAGLVERFYWSRVAQLGRMIRCFQREGVERIVMAGKIHKTAMHTPWRLLRLWPDWRTLRFWYSRGRRDNRDDSILLGVIDEFAADCRCPVVAGFPSGHTSGPCWTLPFGVRCRLVTRHSPTLIVEESPVE